jgi:DNA polymerase-1
MKHLILDANNLLFRARHACHNRQYDNVIVHTFFRTLKPLVELFKPDFVYFVLDGYPKKRMELSSSYKGTREYHDKDNFREQRKKSIALVKRGLPFVVMRHPEMEADDVIADLVYARLPEADEKVIVSSDTDFIQLCQISGNNVKLYNPVKKDFREIPEYDYEKWKSLRGDAADNIPGIPGIGNKRAEKILTEAAGFENLFKKKPEAKEIYEKNLKLISLTRMNDDEFQEVEVEFMLESMPYLHKSFTEMGLKSMVSEKAWEKYIEPFKELKDGRKCFAR